MAKKNTGIDNVNVNEDYGELPVGAGQHAQRYGHYDVVGILLGIKLRPGKSPTYPLKNSDGSPKVDADGNQLYGASTWDATIELPNGDKVVYDWPAYIGEDGNVHMWDYFDQTTINLAERKANREPVHVYRLGGKNGKHNICIPGQEPDEYLRSKGAEAKQAAEVAKFLGIERDTDNAPIPW